MHFASLVFILFSLQVDAADIAPTTCSAKYSGKSFSTIQTGSRTIDIIGWEHPDPPDDEALREGYVTAMQQAKEHDCTKAEKSLRDAIDATKHGFEKASFVKNALENINHVNHIDKVGREISPSEWNILLKQYSSIESDLKEIEAVCGGPIIQALKDFRLLKFGPQLAFTRHNLNATVVGIESREDRLENEKAFEASVTEDFDDLENPHQNFPGYRQIAEALWAQRSPPEDAIKLLAKNVGHDPESAEKQLRNDIAIWQARIVGAYARNNSIVRNVEYQSGHMVIVIGFRHVQDLTNKFLQNCKQLTTPMQSSRQSPLIQSRV